MRTLMPDGAPHVTQVWLDSDGTHILVNTVASHQKVKNVRRDPRVAINVHDPAQPYRIANKRGKVVEMTPAGADEHIDVHTKKYLGVDQYPNNSTRRWPNQTSCAHSDRWRTASLTISMSR